MPEKSIQTEWMLAIISSLWIAFAGVAGALVRQVNGSQKTWSQRIMEWIAGALCAVYMTPVLIPVIHYIVDDALLSQEKIAGFAGFISGAFGITILESLIEYLKNRTM